MDNLLESQEQKNIKTDVDAANNHYDIVIKRIKEIADEMGITNISICYKIKESSSVITHVGVTDKYSKDKLDSCEAINLLSLFKNNIEADAKEKISNATEEYLESVPELNYFALFENNPCSQKEFRAVTENSEYTYHGIIIKDDISELP